MSANRKAIKQFILDRIDFEGYELDPEPTQPNARILAAWEICNREVGHIRNAQARIEYWFSGLCSVISLPYLYAEIIPLLVYWGSLPAEHTDAQADRILGGYWKYMAAQFLQMVHAAQGQ